MSTIISKDQLGNEIEISFPPKRIISLVPSQTEFLFDIGLEEEVIGVTRFCIYPKVIVKAKEKIGGTKQFDLEKIKLLQPDLIIGNKEENYLEGIEELQKHFPVWMSDIFTLQDSYAMMNEISRITNREEEGQKIISEIQTSFKQFQITSNNFKQRTAAYFIWRKPYMVAANNTFINHLLKILGVRNVFESVERYPEIKQEKLAELKPDFIFLSSEPYSFSEKHFEEFQNLSPQSKVVIVNGEMFSWYGSRLKFAAEYFGKLRQQIGITG